MDLKRRGASTCVAWSTKKCKHTWPRPGMDLAVGRYRNFSGVGVAKNRDFRGGEKSISGGGKISEKKGKKSVTPFLINVNFSKFFSAQVIENDFLGGPGFWEFSPARKSRNFGDFSPIFRDFWPPPEIFTPGIDFINPRNALSWSKNF